MRTASFGTFISYRPSEFTETPVVVPLTIIVAPSRGYPSGSVTVPDTVRSCAAAKAIKPHRAASEITIFLHITNFIFRRNPLQTKKSADA